MTKIKTIDISGPVVTIKWADGITVEHDISTLDKKIVWALAADRAKAKLEDAHASLGSKGIEACREATDAVWAALVAGEWRRSGGNGTPWLVTALTECFPDAIDEEKARKIYDDEDTRKKAYKMPEIRAWKAAKDLESVADAKPTDVTKLF